MPPLQGCRPESVTVGTGLQVSKCRFSMQNPEGVVGIHLGKRNPASTKARLVASPLEEIFIGQVPFQMAS